MLLLILLVLLLPVILADTNLDSEVQRATHYAEQYETGNINYVQFLVYMSSVRENLNELLGAVERHHGGLLEEEKLRDVFGEPTHETKWVWQEKEHHEKKLDYEVPRWEKIIFDGKKLQIRLEVHPSLFQKGHWDEYKQEWVGEGEEFLIYRLHFNIEFKREMGEIDFSAKIAEMESLAAEFSANPTSENAEILAKESVNAERAFEEYFRQGGGECLATMNEVLGEENRRDQQNMLVNEITLYEGEDFDAITRLEMCDDCEWNWIGLHMWIDSRTPGGFKMPEKDDVGDSRAERERYRGMTSDGFKVETASLIEEIKGLLAERQFGPAMETSQRLMLLTNAWNEVSNNLWEEVEEIFEQRRASMSEEEKFEWDQDYGWIKEDQERRQVEREKRLQNYEERKNFYLGLFSPYDKKEFYFEQIEFEKRLIQEFKERGKEICNNNIDDNENEEVDCQEDQCGGQICGRDTITVLEGNLSVEKTVDLYCISGSCQAKEEFEEEEEIVCGNHICEFNETVENCAEDCSICPTYEAIECAGDVIFSGEDENGCSLEPVCIEEEEFCEVNEDCAQPLCGSAECVEGMCMVQELAICGEAECFDGEERIVQCSTGEEIIVKICSEGLWKKTGVQCEGDEIDLDCVACGNGCMPREQTFAASCLETTEEFECVQRGSSCEVSYFEEGPSGIAGNECSTISDCGGENDVCSNGKCIPLPEVIHVDEPTQLPQEPEETEEEQQEETEETEETQEEQNVEDQDEETQEEQNIEDQLPEPIAFSLRLLSKITPFGFVTAEDDSNVNGGDDTTQPPEDNTGETPPGETPQDLPDEPYQGEPDEPHPEPYNDGGNCWEECWSVCEGGECHEECYDEEKCEESCSVDDTGAESCETNCHTEQICNEVCEGEECHDECGMVCEGDKRDDHDEGGWEDDRREGEWGEENCGEMCERECFDAKIRPCTDRCIRDVCGEELQCDIDTERQVCEESCKVEKDFDSCVVDCDDQCKSGEWEGLEHEWEEQEWQEEKGVFAVGGSCRTVQGKKEGFIWFNGWGDPFDDVQPLKHKYYMGGEADWCKWDIENLKKKRLEFEQGFNQEFVEWFFEDYMSNSAEDWEQHMSGIYELYWNNVDTLEQTVRRMKCLDKDGLPEGYTPIELISYETEYGSLEYWEEIKIVTLPGPEGKELKDVEMITPYMKVWIFPSKEFIVYELEKSMASGEFPGPPEEKMERENEGGLSEEEKMMLKEDRDFMEKVIDVTDKYGGEVNAVIRFIDYETNDLVFNLYVKINEEDIFEMKPMLPDQVPAEDVRIEMDFALLYDLIYTAEKEMEGSRTETPPWDRQARPVEKVKEFTNGIKMFFKVRKMANSAEVTPADAEKDAEKLFKTFLFQMMRMGGPGDGPPGEGEEREKSEKLEEELFESKEVLTGEVIRE